MYIKKVTSFTCVILIVTYYKCGYAGTQIWKIDVLCIDQYIWTFYDSWLKKKSQPKALLLNPSLLVYNLNWPIYMHKY